MADFATDAHRRVAANLAQPRSLAGLAAVLLDDPYTQLHAPVEDIVGELTEAGHVANVGQHDEPSALVDAVQDDDAAIDLHPEKAAAIVDRLSRRPNLLAGEQYILTKTGLAALEA